jgi:vacuolar-type H+-ATPase subunit F/Vma7
MSRILAMGEQHKVAPFAMVGVEAVAVSDPVSLRRAWAGFRDDVGLVLLTRSAAAALGKELHEPGHPLWVVMS